MIKGILQHKGNTTGNSGNIFFMLFGAVALIGAFSVGANNVMKGIVTSMSDVTRKTIAEERMMSAARLSIMNATSLQANAGDCDTDGMVEPLPTVDPAGAPAPVGGGHVPANIGASQKDPWGTPYGYCAWDLGSVTVSNNNAGCGGSAARRLNGINDPSQTAVALISAGKDRKFSTTCNNNPGVTPANCAGLGSDHHNDPVSGHCYYKGSATANYAAAQALCAANGGYLAVITSDAENTMIHTNIDMSEGMFIGVNDQNTEGAWVYAFGEVANQQFWSGASGGSAVGGRYSRWNIGEPNDAGGAEDCAYIGVAATPNWADIPCGSGTYKYLCEIPATTSEAITKSSGSDDIVMEYSYNDASGISGQDLWKVKDTEPDTATIDKNIEVTGGATFTGAINLMEKGLILPADPGNDSVTGACNVSSAQELRLNTGTSPISLEICHNNAWVPISMGSAPAPDAGGFDPQLGNCISSDGTSLTQVGSVSSIGQISTVEAIDGYIHAGSASGILRAYTFNGSSFSLAATYNNGETGEHGDILRFGEYIITATRWSNQKLRAFTFDGTAYTLAGTIAVGDNTNGLATDGTYIYVAAESSLRAYTFNGSTFALAGSTVLNSGASATYKDGKIYVGNFADVGRVYTFNGSTFTQISQTTDPAPIFFSNARTSFVYNARWGEMYRYSYNTPNLSTSFSYDYPNGITYFGWSDGVNIFLTQDANGISVLRDNGTSFDLIATADTPDDADAITSDGTYVYVADWGGGIIAFSGMGCSLQGSSEAAAEPFDPTIPSCSAGAAGPFVQTASINSYGFRAVAKAKGSDTLHVASWDDGIRAYRVANDGTLSYLGGFDNSTNQWTKTWTDGTYVYATSSYQSPDVFMALNFTGSGYTLIDTDNLTGPGEDIWGQGSSLYVGDKDGGLKKYSFNGTTLTLGATSTYPSWPNDVWGDSNLLYTINSYEGLDVLKDTGTTLSDRGTLNASDSNGVWGDGRYVYAGHGLTLKAFKISSNGTPIELVGTYTRAGQDVTSVWGDGKHIYVGYSTGDLVALTFDGSAFTVVNTYDTGAGQVADIWGDGKFIYTVDAQNYLKVFSGFECTSYTNQFPSAVSNTELDPGVMIAANNHVGKLSAGETHSCALTPDGTAWCWGSDSDGQLGNGPAIVSNRVTKVLEPSGSLSPFTKISVGSSYVCAIKADGTAWCWGDDTDGKLGNGAGLTADQDAPSPVSLSGYTWSDISAGESHACGITTDGTAWCWGRDNNGQVGNGAGGSTVVPVQVSDSDKWVSISAGQRASCGIKTDGTAWCWGDDTGGMLGDDTALASKTVPVPVAEPGPWVKISNGLQHTCGIKADGSAWCWGTNTNGELGVGSAGNRTLPTPVNGEGPWIDIVAAHEARVSCGVKADGSAWCWGLDTNGRLGNGTTLTADQFSPSMVSDPGPWTTISAMAQHGCGMKMNGSAWCWGSDSNGRLGNGSLISGDQASPTPLEYYLKAAPFVWNDTMSLFAPVSGGNIALGLGSGLSYDGRRNASAQPEGLSFDSTTGRSVLRQTGTFGSTSPPATLTNMGLVGYWAFEEATGTTARDSSGYSNNGTLTNGPVYSTGIQGGSLLFDGVNDHVVIPAASSINNLGEMTACAWVSFRNTAADYYGTIVDKTSNGTDRWSVYVRDVNTDGGIPRWGAQGYQGSANINEVVGGSYDDWSHFCAVYNLTNLVPAIYLNGVLIGAASGTAPTLADAANSLKIGMAGAGSRYFRGKIDEVMLFNRTLTQPEILSVMSYTGGPTEQIRGVQLRLKTDSANSASQMTWTTAAGGNTPRSLGIDHATASFEIGPNTGSTQWMNAITPHLEITADGYVGVGTTGTARARLTIDNGGIKIGNDLETCTPLKDGALRFNAGVFEYCNGASWLPL